MRSSFLEKFVHPIVIAFEKRKLEVETEVKKCTSFDDDRVL